MRQIIICEAKIHTMGIMNVTAFIHYSPIQRIPQIEKFKGQQ
jgi:hypothetical protein